MIVGTRSTRHLRSASLTGNRGTISRKVSTKPFSGTWRIHRGGSRCLSVREDISQEQGAKAALSKMRILIVGTGGRLGAALLREYGDKFDAAGFDRSQLDLSDLDG